MKQFVRRNHRRAGLGLVETVMSTLLVGTILVGGMTTVGAVVRHRRWTTDRDRAALLGQQLISEILEKPYVEPDETPAFGLEASETSAPRSAYDDVDDFHGWSRTPPELRDGTVMSEYSNWRRSVNVDYVDPTNLTVSSIDDQGVKRIQVTVFRDNMAVSTVTAIRSGAWRTAE